MAASEGILVLKRSRVNERWRVALAGLAAVLAIPFLVIDSPSTAEGGIVESIDDPAIEDTLAQESQPIEDTPDTAAPGSPDEAAETAPTVVRPNVLALSSLSADWAVARADAIEQGLAAPVIIDAPSDTNLDLLPDVDIVYPPTTEPAPDTTVPEEPEPAPDTTVPEEPEPTVPDPEPAPDPDEGEGEGNGDGDPEPEPEPEPCLLYTSPSPRDQRGSRMPSSA